MNSASERQFARRFHGIFAGLGNLGALFGGLVVGQWTMRLGTLGVPWLTVAALLPSVIFGEMAYRRAIEPRPKTPAQGGERMGAAEFRSQPVLPRILGIVLCTQVMAAVLEVSFQTHLSQGIQSIDSQTAYSGNFFAALSAVSVALQFAVAPLYFGRLSTRVVHVLLPVSNLLAIASLILAPSLWTASLALLVFKSVDYSLFRVAKELLYVPLDFSARYRAKELIDVFGYRLSKGVCSLGLIAIRQSAAGPLYAVIAALAAIGWLASVPGLVRASSNSQE